jgi:hypothetical protein
MAEEQITPTEAAADEHAQSGEQSGTGAEAPVTQAESSVEAVPEQTPAEVEASAA